MRKSFLLILALCTTISVAAQPYARPKLPAIDRTIKDSKWGLKDNSGNCIIPNILDYVDDFEPNQYMSYAQFGKEYFIFDRKGYMATTTSYRSEPQLYDQFVLVDCKIWQGIQFGKAINCVGKELFAGKYVNPLPIDKGNDRFYLFATKQAEKVGYRLVTIHNEVISGNLYGNFSVLPSGAIAFRNSHYTTYNSGVINSLGKVLVPCNYERISFFSLNNIKYSCKLDKTDLPKLYKKDLLETLGVVVAISNDYYTIYDQCGTRLTNPKKYKNASTAIKSNFKKAILPHFMRRGDIMRSVQEKINNPNRIRREEYLTAANKLPIYNSQSESLYSHISYLQEHPNVSAYTFAECYNKGKELYDKNNYQQAIPWLLHAAEGKHSPAYRRLADSYNNTEQFQKAHSWYKRCIKDLTPGSNDYWFACMILGGMFKSGRGCEKNYDTSLYYLRLFHQNTTPINKTTANEMIAEVVALKNKANSQHRQSASSSSSRSQSTSRSSHSPYTPAANTMPNDGNRHICYKNRSGGIASINPFLYKNEWKAGVYVQDSSGAGHTYGFTRQYTGDTEWVFKGGVPTAFYSNDSKKIIMYVAFDWSYIKVDGVVYDIPISKQEYDSRITKVKVYMNNGGGHNHNNSGSSYNNNDSGRSYIDGPCKYCGGGGGCRSCNGRGYKYNPYSGYNDTCPSCNGSGRCFNCHGTGKQATY